MKDEEQRNVRIREDLNWSCCFCHITDASDLLKQEEKWGVKEQMCRIRLFPSSIHVRYLPTERSCDLPVYSHSAAAFFYSWLGRNGGFLRGSLKAAARSGLIVTQSYCGGNRPRIVGVSGGGGRCWPTFSRRRLPWLLCSQECH